MILWLIALVGMIVSFMIAGSFFEKRNHGLCAVSLFVAIIFLGPTLTGVAIYARGCPAPLSKLRIDTTYEVEPVISSPDKRKYYAVCLRDVATSRLYCVGVDRYPSGQFVKVRFNRDWILVPADPPY